MKKFLAAALSTALVLGSTTAPAVLAQSSENDVTFASGQNRTVAFYGAEGGGMWTAGARKALENGEKIEVYHVTNLNDSGEGSFRDAVSKGNRIVVFDVSGYIDLNSNVTIGHDNMTILGQTAPGDGVCFRSNNIKVGANNIILRYLRFRVGAHDAQGNDTRAQDGLEVTDNCQNVIIDHCSVSWGTDENLTAYAVKDVTIQNSIIAEALNQSVHDKGEHSYGGIWGGVNLSVHHNLISTHKSRNPKVGTSETTAMTAGYTDADTLVDMKNNVFYNWGDKAGYGTENGAKTYIQKNIYRPGPATPAGKRSRIFELSVGQKYQTNMLGSVYAFGNRIDVDSNDSDYEAAALVNENNWQDSLHTGVYVDKNFYSNTDKSNIKIETSSDAYKIYEKYENEYPIALDAVKDVYEKVLTNAGATLPKRDAVDARIIDNVRNRTAPTGSKGSVGLVDDPTDCIPAGSTDYDGRGYPAFSNETRAANFDSDKDGIPDTWEESHGLNKNNPMDSTLIGPEGYTWLEIYVEYAITRSKYADGLNAAVNVSQAIEYKSENEITASNLGDNVTEVEFYCDDELLETAANNSGSAVLKTKAINAGTRYITAIAKDNSGNGSVSNTVLVNCYNKSDSAVVESWTGNNASVADEKYILGPDSELSQSVSGDFDFVAEIEELGVMGTSSEIKLSVGGNSISYGYDNYALKIKCNSADISDIDCNEYKLFKISRTGNSLNISIGKNLAEWTEVGAAQLADANAEIKIGAVGGVGILNVLRVITEDKITEPKAAITNIEENQRLGFSEDIQVKVTPDSKAGVSEVYIYLDDTAIASYKADELITSETVVTIPVSFSGIAKGSLRAVCIDVNLGTSTDTRNVVVSQDIAPWSIADIGKDANEEKTYISVTDDYTYKINSTSGLIGGTSDEFGYMYQSFRGDGRIYYRSRMQSAEQFGIMFKSDLDADGAAYYFGGNKVDGSLRYQLMARTQKGGEMTVVKDVTDEIGASANLYFVAEKAGNKINIYQTENGATIYTTKKLIASVDAAVLGDTYYMGYAATYKDGYQNSADVGWVGIEKVSDNGASYVWDFDNGLDWVWQMQEKNVLRHKYTSDSVSGNSTGKMLLAPDENYIGNRYVFHEYIMEDKYLPKLNADVFLNGDAPALNVYFQTGIADKAYKVSFRDDGKIYVNYNDNAATTNGTEIGVWEIGKWYNVEVKTVLDETTNFETWCNITVKDKDGNVVGSLNNAPLGGSGIFRTQINTAKKTSVTKAVYFEPISTAKGSYYIDNVMVTAVKGRYEINKTEKFLTFTNEADGALGAKTYDNGFAVSAGHTVEVKNNTISDEGFSKRIKIDSGNASKNTVIIPTGIKDTGSCDIQFYAAAGGSSDRYLVVCEGTKEITRIKMTPEARFDYTYEGSAENLTVYASSKNYIYGIKVINTTITENTDITAITGYDAATGEVSVSIGDTDVRSVTAVVAQYDENDRVLRVVNSEDFAVSANTKVTIPTSVIDGAGASYRVFLFDSMTNVSPICESFRVESK